MKNNNKRKFLTNFRIALAIAWKDILEGWKNKIILTSVITALFLVIFYYYLPDLTRGDKLPILVILDPSEQFSQEDIAQFTGFSLGHVYEEEDFLNLIRDIDTPGIGIVVEKEQLNSQSGDLISIPGFYPNWMKPSQIDEVKNNAELMLEEQWQTPVEIATEGNIVYPVMDNYAFGKTFIASAGLLLQIILMGLSMAPQLIIEEKDSRTLQAIMVSPANLGHFVLGKTIAVLFYTCLTSAIGLCFVGSLVIHWGLTITALLIGMLTIITPGVLLGVLFESKQQMSIWIWVLFIPTMLPLFLSVVRVLPEPLMKIVDWWPTTALLRFLRAGFTLNPPVSTYGIEAIYLLSLSLIFLGLTRRAAAAAE